MSFGGGLPGSPLFFRLIVDLLHGPCDTMIVIRERICKIS